MLWKCCTQHTSKFGKLNSESQELERSVFIPVPKKGNAKECSNYCTIATISHTSKVMLKILQARFQQYMNFQMFKLDLEKAGEPEIKLSTSVGSLKKQENSIKTSTSVSLIMLKPLTVWMTKTMEKLLKRWEYQTTWLSSWEICIQVKKQQLELNMEQQTDSKLGKDYVKAIYCHPAHLTYMQSTSWEMLGWMKYKL